MTVFSFVSEAKENDMIVLEISGKHINTTWSK